MKWKTNCKFKCFVPYLQGGFAKCYELTDVETKELFAGKVVPKSLLVKQHQKDKVLYIIMFIYSIIKKPIEIIEVFCICIKSSLAL